jgi:hypothetical protein
VATVLGEVQGVDILLVALESIPDGFASNVPNLEISAFPSAWRYHTTYSDQFVFSSSGQISTVWAEAHTPDVQISLFVNCVVLKLADFLASIDIVYLGRSIAACRNILAILAETDTTYDTFVQKIVKKLDIKNSG